MPRGGAKPGERRGGRQKGTPNKVTADVRELAQKYGPQALEVLSSIMMDEEKPPAARVSAAKEILDRAYGKAPQPVSVQPADFAEMFSQVMQELPN